MNDLKKFGLMQFFRLVLLLFFSQSLYANNLIKIDDIITKERGSCLEKNLMFTALKFYKIPLEKKINNHDVYLRILLFLNKDLSVQVRLTEQELIQCQTSNGENICSYKQLSNEKIITNFTASPTLPQTFHLENFGDLIVVNESNLNRGFNIKIDSLSSYPELLGKEFIGGLVLVNFDQYGNSVSNICK